MLIEPSKVEFSAIVKTGSTLSLRFLASLLSSGEPSELFAACCCLSRTEPSRGFLKEDGKAKGLSLTPPRVSVSSPSLGSIQTMSASFLLSSCSSPRPIGKSDMLPLEALFSSSDIICIIWLVSCWASALTASLSLLARARVCSMRFSHSRLRSSRLRLVSDN